MGYKDYNYNTTFVTMPQGYKRNWHPPRDESDVRKAQRPTRARTIPVTRAGDVTRRQRAEQAMRDQQRHDNARRGMQSSGSRDNREANWTTIVLVNSVIINLRRRGKRVDGLHDKNWRMSTTG